MVEKIVVGTPWKRITDKKDNIRSKCFECKQAVGTSALLYEYSKKNKSKITCFDCVMKHLTPEQFAKQIRFVSKEEKEKAIKLIAEILESRKPKVAM